MANLERGCDATNTHGDRVVRNEGIQNFLVETMQDQLDEAHTRNGGAHRCPGEFGEVELYDSEDEKPVAPEKQNLNDLNFEPEEVGEGNMEAAQTPAAIAEEYTKKWQDSWAFLEESFLQDVHDLVKNADDQDAVLKELTDRMNEIFADPAVRQRYGLDDIQVEFEMDPDGRVDVRQGDNRYFRQMFIDLTDGTFSRY